MEIYKISDIGIFLKSKESLVSINQPEKCLKSLTPETLLETFPVAVKGWSQISKITDEQHRFTGAGEYERNGIIIQGFSSSVEIEKNKIQATSWYVVIENMKLFFSDTLQEKDDLIYALNEIGDIDIFVVVCSKDARLTAKDIQQCIAQSSPKYIILIGNNSSLKKDIADEVGSKDNATSKFVIKKKQCEEASTTAILLD